MGRLSFATLAGLAAAAMAALAACPAAAQPSQGCDYDDSHFHLTNYIQEGPSAGSARYSVAITASVNE